MDFTEKRISKVQKEAKLLRNKNRRMRLDLKRNGDFLEKVVNSFNTVDYVEKYSRDTHLNLKKIKHYQEKISEVELKIEERLRELEDIELVEKTLY